MNIFLFFNPDQNQNFCLRKPMQCQQAVQWKLFILLVMCRSMADFLSWMDSNHIQLIMVKHNNFINKDMPFIDSQTDWLSDCLSDWLAGWLAGWLTSWLAGRLTVWLTDWLAGWKTDCLTGWLADWQTDWLTDWVTVWLTEWLTEWLSDWLTDWLTVWLAGWLTTDWLMTSWWLTGWWLTGWLTEWMTDWLTVWLTGWLVGWLSGSLTVWLAGWLTVTDWLTDCNMCRGPLVCQLCCYVYTLYWWWLLLLLLAGWLADRPSLFAQWAWSLRPPDFQFTSAVKWNNTVNIIFYLFPHVVNYLF